MADQPPGNQPDDGSSTRPGYHPGYEDWTKRRPGAPFIEPEPDGQPDVPGNEPLGPQSPSKEGEGPGQK